MDSFWPPKLDENIWTLVLLVLLFGAAVQWMCWIGGWGRFKAGRDTGQRSQHLRVVIADLFVKVIDDFRHLLALIVVLMYSATLIYALYIAGTNIDNLGKALQAVTGTLSGVIGVIIGYYFGESAARARIENDGEIIDQENANVQKAPSTTKAVNEIQKAPPPPETTQPNEEDQTPDP